MFMTVWERFIKSVRRRYEAVTWVWIVKKRKRSKIFFYRGMVFGA